MIAQKYKMLFLKLFDFRKNLKIHKKLRLNRELFNYCFILYKETYKEKMLTDKTTIQRLIVDGREAV